MLSKLMMVDKSSTPSITYMYNVSVDSQAFVITLHAQCKSDCKQLKVYQCEQNVFMWICGYVDMWICLYVDKV